MPGQLQEWYRFLEHVSDAFIEAWGETFEGALAQAGLAFSNIITDTNGVQPSVSEQMTITGHDELELVYNWLEELLLRFEIHHLVFCRFHINPVARRESGLQLVSKVEGEKFDPARHTRKVEVKGVTYHLMTVERAAGRTLLRFILDL